MTTPLRKILYVHYQKSLTDGSSVHIQQFSESFRHLCQQAGIELHVIGPEPLSATISPNPGRLHGLKTKLAQWYLREFKVLARQIHQAWKERQLLQRYRPDIVLTRYDAETQSIHWACRSLGIPVVSEFNGRDRRELAGTYAAYRQLPFLNRLFSNCTTLRLSAGAMGVSPLIVQDLQRCNPQGKPVIVNHNGVDLHTFRPDLACDDLRTALGIPPRRLVIGYAGSFIVWHEPGRLLRAFERLTGTQDCHLLLVGRRIAEITTLIEKMPSAVRRRIHLTGFVPHREIPRYLALMDIAVLPNTQPYCSPLKLFEYMAMAKACIAPATPAIREVIEPGREGWLFDPQDETAFFLALQHLANDAALRRRLGNQARIRIEREFTWQHNAQRTLQLLKEAFAWYQATASRAGSTKP